MPKGPILTLLDRHVFPRINDVVLGANVAALRREVVSAARGRVLEIGAGTGLNFPLYVDAEVVAIEPNEGMRQRASVRASEARSHVEVLDAKSEALPFDAGCFDTVVTTFVFCSVRDLETTLREVRRVLKPRGELRFVEHGLSDDRVEAKWQTRIEPIWRTVFGGCDPTRRIASAIENAGFDIGEVERVSLPLPYLARPGWKGVARR